MPEKELFDKDNNPVDNVFTEDEVNKRIEEAKTEAEQEKEQAVKEAQESVKSEIQEKEEEIKKREEAVKEAENSSDDEKTKNLTQLRKQKEEAEKKLEQMKGEHQKNIADILAKADERRISEAMKSVVGENEDMAKQVKEKFDYLQKAQGGVPEDSGELRKMISDAYTLVTGTRPESKITGDVTSSAGAGPSSIPKGKISEKGKEVASQFGISEDDIDKYESGELGKK